MKTLRLALPLALVASSLAACGSGSGSAAGTKTSVVVGFYPLQYLAQRIGGDHVTVTSLTEPGKEPHDIELSPQQVAQAGKADLGIYSKGLQPVVDDAFSATTPRHLLDVAPAAGLDRTVAQAVAGGVDPESHAGDKDPHFWLDPVKYAAVATAIEKNLADVDPTHKGDYEKNLAAVTKDLTALDTDMKTGLASCANKDVVTSHAAFGYLAARYGLTQKPIAGISPEQEPEPRQLAQVADFVRKNKVTTIYTETLASPAIAKTVAAETGAQVAVLDPVEGITAASAAQDYLGIMRANLAALKKGQSCS